MHILTVPYQCYDLCPSCFALYVLVSSSGRLDHCNAYLRELWCGLNEFLHYRYVTLLAAHSQRSVNGSRLYRCSFLPLHIRPTWLPGLAVCTLSCQTEGLPRPCTSPWPIPCCRLLVSKSCSALRPSSRAWSSRSYFFILVFVFPMPGSSVPLILLGTAAFFVVSGCLRECLSSLLRPSTLGGVHLGFPKRQAQGTFRICLSNSS